LLLVSWIHIAQKHELCKIWDVKREGVLVALLVVVIAIEPIVEERGE